MCFVTEKVLMAKFFNYKEQSLKTMSFLYIAKQFNKREYFL